MADDPTRPDDAPNPTRLPRAVKASTTLLVAVWRGQPGCESIVLSNWVLGRDDQIGCPIFTPIDEAEARVAARNGARVVAGSNGRSSR